MNSGQWLSFLAGHAIHPKLTLSHPGDADEREADAVADRVMRMASPDGAPIAIAPGQPQVARACSACEQDDDKGRIARKAVSLGGAQAAVRGAAEAVAAGGQPLDVSTRAWFEPRFGRDLSKVRIHSGPGAHQAATGIGAMAYTHGQNIAFAKGVYQPETESGKRLLAHELAHTVQQGSETRLRRQARRRRRGTGGPAQICGRDSRKVSGNWITQVNIDVGANSLTIVWNNPGTAPSNSTGPFDISPGAGLCCLNCNDPATSQRSGSLCTPKGGSWPVDGVGCQLGGHPTARNPTRFQRSGIAIHSGNTAAPPRSHGCSRTSLRVSELIHDNVRVGQTMISSSGTWAGTQCYQTEDSETLVSRATFCRANTPSGTRRRSGGGGGGGTPAPVRPAAPEPTESPPTARPVAATDILDGPGPNNEPVEQGPDFGELEDDLLAQDGMEEEQDDSENV